MKNHYRKFTILRLISSALLCASTISAPITLRAGELEGSIFAIERYRSVKRSYLTERYDIFCLQRPGFMVEIPWGAKYVYGDVTKGQIEVELIDMGMIECKHGWDLHAMGHVRLGSGGTEWAAVYNDEYLVRFTALSAEVIYAENGDPSISAMVHPLYCEYIPGECQIEMKLPM